MSGFRRPVASAVLAALLLAPATALSMTDEELKNFDITSTGSETPRLDGGSFNGLKVILALALVLAVIYALWWLLRKTQRRGLPGRVGAGDAVEVLSTTVVGPQRNLHLVRVGDDVLLLGATDHGITALHRVAHDDAVVQGLLPAAAGDSLDLELGLAIAPLGGSPPQGRRRRPKSVGEALRDLTAR